MLSVMDIQLLCHIHLVNGSFHELIKRNVLNNTYMHVLVNVPALWKISGSEEIFKRKKKRNPLIFRMNDYRIQLMSLEIRLFVDFSICIIFDSVASQLISSEETFSGNLSVASIPKLCDYIVMVSLYQIQKLWCWSIYCYKVYSAK